VWWKQNRKQEANHFTSPSRDEPIIIYFGEQNYSNVSFETFRFVHLHFHSPDPSSFCPIDSRAAPSQLSTFAAVPLTSVTETLKAAQSSF
jgi:hypothetical protein